MKKVLSFLLALGLLASLCACGGTPSPAANTGTSGANAVADVYGVNPEIPSLRVDTPAPEMSDEAGTPALSEDIAESVLVDSDAAGTPALSEDIAESVLVDEAGVKITVKGLNKETFLGPELKFLIENDSGQNLTFQCRDTSVNGYMVGAIMSADVADGKKANDSLSFSLSDLAQCGITTFADIEFSFHIFDSKTWKTYLDTEKIQLKTSAAASYEYRFDDSGELAYEGNDIKIVVKGLSENASYTGPGVIVYIDNASEQDLTVQVRNESVNGFMMSAIFSSEVCAGKHAIDAIIFRSTALAENGIEKIEDVELSFHIFTSDGWDTVVDTDAITIHFNAA